MDLLEKYKKAWENQPEETNKVSKVDIYKMAQAKSSSIVKWIFIIGILEFVILNASSFIFMDSKNSKADNLIREVNLVTFFDIYIALNYVVVAYFLYQFYKNYKNICVIDDTKTLMSKIIKTRKTVKYYVAYNLLSGGFVFLILTFGMATHTFNDFSTQKTVGVVAILVVVAIIVLGLIWLFYQLLYGILLKKLHTNYKELATLDELK